MRMEQDVAREMTTKGNKQKPRGSKLTFANHVYVAVVFFAVRKAHPGRLVEPNHRGVLVPRVRVARGGGPVGVHGTGAVFRQEREHAGAAGPAREPQHYRVGGHVVLGLVHPKVVVFGAVVVGGAGQVEVARARRGRAIAAQGRVHNVVIDTHSYLKKKKMQVEYKYAVR